jgi:hypothetical protein
MGLDSGEIALEVVAAAAQASPRSELRVTMYQNGDLRKAALTKDLFLGFTGDTGVAVDRTDNDAAVEVEVVGGTTGGKINNLKKECEDES